MQCMYSLNSTLRLEARDVLFRRERLSWCHRSFWAFPEVTTPSTNFAHYSFTTLSLINKEQSNSGEKKHESRKLNSGMGFGSSSDPTRYHDTIQYSLLYIFSFVLLSPLILTRSIRPNVHFHLQTQLILNFKCSSNYLHVRHYISKPLVLMVFTSTSILTTYLEELVN